MQVEIFAICDAATDYGGRLNLLGAFEGLAVPEVPCQRGRCSVALRLRCPEAEAGKHSVEVEFIDPDGKQVMTPMRAAFAVKIPRGRSSVATNLVLNINGLPLRRFGEHQFALKIDGERAAAIPLLVAQAKRGLARNPLEN